MRPEFMIERNGKAFCLYAGLLDEAHNRGLKEIRTTLLQIPDESNMHVAICMAEVTTEQGIFTGIGDAAPNNVARPMQTCTIRMAETRAKARALRDAVNVGVAAFEELDVDDPAPAAASRPAAIIPARIPDAPLHPAPPAAQPPGQTKAAAPAPAPAAQPANHSARNKNPRENPDADPCTAAQKRMLQDLSKQKGQALPQLATMSRGDASRLITKLKAAAPAN